MRFNRKYLLTFLFLFLGYESFATHLVGGSMSYEYLGLQNNGAYRYRVTVKMYRDCQASTVPFDPDISIGFYNNNASRSIEKVQQIPQISESPVDPPDGGSNCDFQPNVCLRQAIYQGIVDLPASTSGYHLVYQRCCRNTQENILDNLGQTYYAFIPATSIPNNSPFFTEVPAPYICVNDLVSLVNTARDIDGDSLVYQLAKPWAAGSDNDPVPPVKSTWPEIPNFDPVVYRSGYNENIPFGITGTANIDSRNGVTEMLSPKIGRFSIAIDVYEYRNGVQLSRIRLDIQMIVIACTPNLIPTVGTSTNTNYYEITEGEQLCFDVVTNDGDNNNLKLTGSGEVFTGGPGFGNLATFNTKTGTGNVTSTFCWTPSCGRAKTAPYQVTFESQDDGCPPKRRLENISILVKPFVGVTSITGPDEVCANQNNVAYTVAGSSSSVYTWTISGGTLASGQGTITASVNWGAGPVGKVEVFETSLGGCGGNKGLKIDVNILPAPTTPDITGKDTVCEFSTGSVYSIPNTTGHILKWLVTGGNIVGSNTSNSISVNWLTKGNGKIFLIQTNSLGCSSDTAIFSVAIERSEIDSLAGTTSVCPNIRGVEYFVVNPPYLSTYVWTINGGIQASGANTSRITVDWGGVGQGYVEVYAISRHNCVSEPIRMDVTINHVLQGMVPVGEDTLCELSTGIKYEVTKTNRSIYNWNVVNGTIIMDDQGSSVIIDWGSAGTGQVIVQEISFDSINNLPCIGIPRTLNVYLAPYPEENPIIGVDELCQSTTAELFYIEGMSGSEFTWTYSGSTPLTGQGNDSVYLVPSIPGSYILTAMETSMYGCEGPVVTKEFVVHPKPTTTGIFGEEIVCFPHYNARDYSVEGFDNSVYTWTVNGAVINSGQGTKTLNLDFTGQPDNTIEVFEVSEFGCQGDLLQKDVFADNPSIDLRVISVMLGDDSKMEVNWDLINAPKYNSNFQVQRRVAGGAGNWINAGSVTGTEFFFLDKGLNTDQLVYEYRVIGYNLCGDTLFSDIHRNVQIKGDKFIDDDYAVWLNWSRYNGWTDGVMFYELHRKDGDQAYSLLNNTGVDTNDRYSDGTKSFRHCYVVKATQNSGNEISYSNEICFNFDPILLVPNAFTPNADGLNSEFEMVSASIKTFTVTIYDRWGEVLYEGNDVSRFWNGTYRGKPCPDGVYVYMIRYTGYDDRPAFLRGNVTILR